MYHVKIAKNPNQKILKAVGGEIKADYTKKQVEELE